MNDRLTDNLAGKQHDYMAPFLWLHGEDPALVIAELERVYESGIRSVCFESRTHENFCRDQWWSDMRVVMDWCREKGMKVWILDDKHFPSGHAVGAFYRKENDHLRPWGITEGHMDICGPVEEGCVMADCWKTAPEDTFVAVLACRHVPGEESYTEIVDITEGLHDGMVYFTLPEGMWRILFLVKTRSGLDDFGQHYCDMLSEESVKVFVDEVYESHYAHLKEYFGDPFLGFFSDEPSFRNNTRNAFTTECGQPFAHYPWHDKLLPMLEQRLGSDARKMLAGLWFEIPEITPALRYAYMDLISKEYSRNYCAQLGAWCRGHGLLYIGHVIEDNNAHAMTGHGTAHYFRALADQDMSGIDIVLHQLIPGLTECSSAGYVCYRHMENEFFHYALAKLASSLAHFDPRKQGRAMCEIFGAFGWAEGTRFMKYLADHMLVRGINYFVPHAFSPKPNDPDCPPNFYDTGKNALYPYFRDIMDYMNRVCHLHNGGVHVPCAAVLYDAEGRWMNGQRMPLEKCAKVLCDNLLDYDILPADVLDQIDEEGCLNGEKYPCLIVPYYADMPGEIIDKLLRQKVKTVLVPATGMEIREKELAESCAVAPLEKLADFVRENVGADVKTDYSGIFLRYYHYRKGGVHSYMFSSEDARDTVRAEVTLSAFSGGAYILYDAMANKAWAGYSADGKIALELPPYNSVFVLCGDISTDGLPKLEQAAYESREIRTVYHISCREATKGEFVHWRETDKLCNVTGRENLPRFSGDIRYEFDLTAQPGETLLDLGRVGEAARVEVNGVDMGRRLTAPYIFEVSSALKPGANRVSVTVSNHSGYRERDDFSRYMLFEPSGLLGPVTMKRKVK